MAILQVNILGTSFALNAEGDLPYLEECRDYYKNVCDQIQRNDGISDQKQIAVLAGILISEELQKERLENLKKEKKSQNAENEEFLSVRTERLAKEMIKKIDYALEI